MTTELSISGVLPSALYSSALERLSSFCERGEAFIASEEVLARSTAGDGPGAGGAADAAAAGAVLRVKALRTRSTGDAATWSLQINGRPEPPRMAPRAQQYGVTELAVEDGSDPREVASALGYGRSLFKLRRRGVRFQRGAVTVELFQLHEADDSPTPLDPASYAVAVSTRFTAAPSTAAASAGGARGAGAGSTGGGGGGGGGAASQEVREASIAALEDVARLLKGLVDLHRVD
ncbi:hypothetical protein DMC30DRAFT_447175 [Rhodotorula diobovata]|uniref:Mediator of RNA polymerase II transcription subunit 18 n=1 Tax=Rhodotorula diobovata TaxID=5288 RepID=A0A5C5FVQ6_9BASI|nr:hypothetical protein DMC30DRAFT_447175 [Rhodotorula diobovata]